MTRGRVLCAAVVVAAGLAGCAGPADSPSGLAAWASQASFSSTLAYLHQDLSEIATGIAQRKLLATRTACDGLGADAASAIGQLPTPDDQLTYQLNDAYKTLVRAAQACSVAPSFTAPDFARYEVEARHGAELLQRAERRFHRLGG